MSRGTESNDRHAAWMDADDGLFKSVQETKSELAKAVTGLDFNAGVCSATKSAIAASLQELDECQAHVDVTKQTLKGFDQLVSELSEKIAELHLQISKTRRFIARETVAHHDQIAMGLTSQELLQINELNAFMPESLHVYQA